MNCKFCNKPCRLIKQTIHIADTELWLCDACPNKVNHRIFTSNKELMYTLIYFPYRGKEYFYKKWSPFMLNNKTMDYRFGVKKDAFCCLANSKIMDVPHTDNITPSNVQEKFQLYMTFS